jgi:peptidyl-prolyl cis-trans isomerase SurA
MRRVLPFLLLFSAAPLAAQQSPPKPPELVNRIIAVVGDSIILNSDVEEQLELMEARGQAVPRTDTAAFAKLRREIIDQIADQLVLLQAAQRDSAMTVNEDQLSTQAEAIINERRQAVGGQANFETALRQQRMTLNEYREMLFQDLRRQALIQQFMGKLVRDRKAPPLPDKELRKIFDERKATLQPLPPSISFRHVVITPRGSDTARARARVKADSVLQMLKAGQDFAELAKRFSDDAASKELGGSLGWARPSRYVKEFGDAINSLRVGETSGLVESSFGFHIIRVEKRRGGESEVRHILISPVKTEGDEAAEMERGKRIADQLRAGADIDSLAKIVGDPTEQVRVDRFSLDRLKQASPIYAEQLANAKAGDIVGPFVVGAADGPRRVAIVKVEQITAQTEPSFDDPEYRSRFREQVAQQRLVEEIIGELRRQTYVRIRP